VVACVRGLVSVIILSHLIMMVYLSLLAKDIFTFLRLPLIRAFIGCELCLEFMYDNAEEVAHDEHFRMLPSEVIISFCKTVLISKSEK